MKSNDSRADNLFSRLISYTPQEGGQTPLENFCTESLAWCLKVSPQFRTKFLNLIRDRLSKKANSELFPTDFEKSQIEIHTQLGFRENQESEHGNDTTKERGIFDLVIYSDNFVLVIEVKFYSGFGETQIPKYRKELDGGQSFPNCAGKFLVGLTRQIVPEKLQKDLDATISWPQVLEKLLETMSRTKDLPPNDWDSSGVSFMLGQFADFLKRKHVTPMKIDTINPEDLRNWTSYFNFQIASNEILERFRDEQKDTWNPKKIGNGFTEDNSNSFFWWGVYSWNHTEDWCGFLFFYSKIPPELIMQVEGPFPKGTKLDQVKLFLGEVLTKAVQQKFYRMQELKDSTWFIFRQPINSDYNGKAEAMYEWLASASKEFSELRKKLI